MWKMRKKEILIIGLSNWIMMDVMTWRSGLEDLIKEIYNLVETMQCLKCLFIKPK